jgi:hypothetical protein
LNNKDVSLALAGTFTSLGLSPELALLQDPTAADGASAFIVGNARRRAALLISPVQFPKVVSEAQARAQAMRDYLGPALGSVIFTPLAQGDIEGRSYVVLPFGRSLANSRLLWLLQKPRIRRILLRWLQAVATQFSKQSPAEKGCFANLLEHLHSVPRIDPEIKKVTAASIERLGVSSFRPRFVPMHNDLWKGNILLPSNSEMSRATTFSFFLIDWRGSRIKGFPFFDAIRLSSSFNFSSDELRQEIATMCKSLECELSDVKCYVAAALGELSTRLEYFPLETFLDMTTACFSELRKAGIE